MNRISNVSIANKINLKFPLLYAEAKGKDKVEIEYLGNCGDELVSDCIDKVYHDDNLQWVSSNEADGFATYILKTKGSNNACSVNSIHKFRIEIYKQIGTGLTCKAHWYFWGLNHKVIFHLPGFGHELAWSDPDSISRQVTKYVDDHGLSLIASVSPLDFWSENAE